MSIDAQRHAKSVIIRDALERIGKRTVVAPEVRPSPVAWRYRNKLTLALRRRGGEWIAGLHPYDAPGRVFALEDCPITDERVLEVWRSVLSAARSLPDAAALRGAVRAGDGETSFVLEGGTDWPGAAEMFAAVPALGSLWWTPEGEARRLLLARGATPTSPAFTQVNPGMAAELRTHVLARIAALAPSTVVDAYAGEGELAEALERAGIGVTTIEIDPEAVARTRARLSSGARVIEGRVEETLQPALPTDVVVLNPPRTGLDERVTSVLNEEMSARDRGLPDPASRVARPALLYVSCNPATLARDLARLPDYRITSLVGFDMFPQTAHVETVCELIPGRDIE
jgi:23S rRNA (uracil1939-C5)-methyltransferase